MSYKSKITSRLVYFLLKNMSKKRFFDINRQILSYLLVFSFIFQNNYAFSQNQQLDNPVPDVDDPEEQITEYSLESLNRLQSLRVYDPDVILTINEGSFSLMPGVYGESSVPVPGRDYIPHTKLGRSIEYLEDAQLMINEVYYLHNALVGKVREIILEIRRKNGDSETVVRELRDLIDRRNNPSIEIKDIGVAELTQIDGQFVVRVVSANTDTAFYILNEAVISEDSDHLQKVEGRQHFEAGANRLDGEEGRDVIFLWVDGRRNTRTTVSPRIEVTPGRLQTLIPFYQGQDPQQFQLTQRRHRQLRREDRWNAIRHPITLNDLSFGSAKAAFQACLIGGVGIAQERLTGQNVNFPFIMTMAALLALIPCSFPSPYRHWLNMGPMGFLQKRKDHVTIDSHNSIDWKETARSKAVRASISSIILAYGFLASTYWDDFQYSESWWTVLYLFIVINAIAISNILLNATTRVWWAEQAFVNELAGVTRGRMRFTEWSWKNFDYFWVRYFFYDITRLFHLAGLGRLPDSINRGFLGVNLQDLGVNFGLFSLIGSYLIGKFVLLRKVLNFQQRGLLENEQTWDYLTRMHSNLGQLLLYIEIFYRRASASWHERYISDLGGENLRNFVSNQYEEESHLDLLDLTEEEKRHLTRWQEHQQVQFSAEQELSLYDVRQKISRDLAILERDFFDEASLEAIVSYRQRVETFFTNRFEAIREVAPEIRLFFQEETLDSTRSHLRERLNHIVSNYNNYISEREQEHVVMESSYRQQVRTSFRNLIKVIHGLFETLKAYYLSDDALHSRDVYLPIWERYRSLEQEDWLKFLEEHVTEDLPSLRRSLALLLEEEDVLVEDIDTDNMPDMNVLLENLLNEVGTLLRNNWKAFETYIDEQEIEDLLKTYSSRESLDAMIRSVDNQKKAEMNHLRRISGRYNYSGVVERISQRKRKNQAENRVYNYNIRRFCQEALTKKVLIE